MVCHARAGAMQLKIIPRQSVHSVEDTGTDVYLRWLKMRVGQEIGKSERRSPDYAGCDAAVGAVWLLCPIAHHKVCLDRHIPVPRLPFSAIPASIGAQCVWQASARAVATA